MSEIRATTISDAAGTGPIALTGQSAAKHFCNWNGTGTPAILESFNTASLTDVGTAEVTVNLSSAMSSANYGVTLATSGGDTNITYNRGGSNTASAIKTYTTNLSSVGVESISNTTATHGDLA